MGSPRRFPFSDWNRRIRRARLFLHVYIEKAHFRESSQISPSRPPTQRLNGDGFPDISSALIPVITYNPAVFSFMTSGTTALSEHPQATSVTSDSLLPLNGKVISISEAAPTPLAINTDTSDGTFPTTCIISHCTMQDCNRCFRTYLWVAKGIPWR